MAGLYTQLMLNVNLKPDTPDDVINVIRYMTTDSGKEPMHEVHPLFDTRKWHFCLLSHTECFMGRTMTSFTEESYGWSLVVHASCRNYDNEYQKFLDYIQPYIWEQGFIGCIRFEEDEMPTIIINDFRDGIFYV